MKYSIAHAIIRDDGRYLDEWIRYHHDIGFEHFVIYDHESDVPVVNKWGDLVTLIRIELKDMSQWPKIFNNTLKNFKAVWLATLDIDEFIVLRKHKSVNDLLVNYEDYGGLGINWMVYGSSGHVKIPEGLVTDNYLWRPEVDYPANVHVKSISQMKYCLDIFNVHTCKSTKPIVNEDYGEAHGLSNSSRKLCRINHYTTRSLEDYQRKIELGNRTGVTNNWSMAGFDDVQKHSNTYDDILKDFWIPNRGHHYGIIGWFNFESLYIDMVGRFDNAVFVEIGCWKGRSTVFMADRITLSGKNIKFFAIDIWEPFVQEDGIIFHSTYDEFLENIEPVKDTITSIKGSSHEVYKQFADKSIDFLFIDGNHDYEPCLKDIQLWMPKMKDGSVIAGHDYQFNGVRKAVDEMFMGRINLKYYESTSSWFVDV